MPSFLKKYKSKKEVKKDEGVAEEKKDDEVVVPEHDYTVTLPAGRIGIKFVGKPPRITKVHDDSPIVGKVEVGHTICGVTIDGATRTEAFNPTALANILKKDPEGERILLVQGTFAPKEDVAPVVDEADEKPEVVEKAPSRADERSVGTSDDVDEVASKKTEETEEAENDEASAQAPVEKTDVDPEVKESKEEVVEEKDASKEEPDEKEDEPPKVEEEVKDVQTERKAPVSDESEQEEAAVEDSMKLCGISPAQLCGIGA